MTGSESVEKGIARVDYLATTMNPSAVIELDNILLESSPVDKFAA